MSDWRSIPLIARMIGLVRGTRQTMRSRRSALFSLAGLIIVGGLAAGAIGDGDDRSDTRTSRLDSFREAAPATFSFFDGWWNRGSEDSEIAAVTLITRDVREEFFRGIPFGEIIHERAEEHDVDPALVAAIMEVESAFEIDARSARGAVGLMQLRPSTGRWMGARNLSDPYQNIDAGTKYLKYLEKRFEGDLRRQLAAYNAGEGTVIRYGGVPPYPETRRYIRKVLQNYERRNIELQRFHRDWLAKGAQ